MTESDARYEFRAFAHDFGMVEETLRRLGTVERYRESREIYLVSAGNDENNTKVRGGLMDVKVLVQRSRGLEQWRPRMKGEFPLSRGTLRDELFPAFDVAAPELVREHYTLEQLLAEVVAPRPELAAVHVYKQRLGFELDGCTAELANVYVNGALLRSTCLESLDADRVVEMRGRLHLGGYENVNYLLAIKRVIGMAPLPDGSIYQG